MYVVYYYHLVIILHSYILPSPILAAWNLGGIPIALERGRDLQYHHFVDKYNEGYISYISPSNP